MASRRRDIDSGRVDSLGRRIKIGRKGMANGENIDARRDSIKNLDRGQKWRQAMDNENHYALAADPDYTIRRAVAEKATNVHILSELSYDEDWSVREGVARNQNAPRELISDMIDDDSDRVRQAVLSNPQCDHYVLSDWSMKGNADERAAVASNPNTDNLDLASLTNDESAKVRLASVYNPSITEGMLLELSKDSEDIVRSEAERVHWSKMRDEERRMKK